jgi:hypothetical protein
VLLMLAAPKFLPGLKRNGDREKIRETV